MVLSNSDGVYRLRAVVFGYSLAYLSGDYSRKPLPNSTDTRTNRRYIYTFNATRRYEKTVPIGREIGDCTSPDSKFALLRIWRFHIFSHVLRQRKDKQRMPSTLRRPLLVIVRHQLTSKFREAAVSIPERDPDGPDHYKYDAKLHGHTTTGRP